MTYQYAEANPLECSDCGAAVLDLNRHTKWHQDLDRALGPMEIESRLFAAGEWGPWEPWPENVAELYLWELMELSLDDGKFRRQLRKVGGARWRVRAK